MMKFIKSLLLGMLQISRKRRELFATFFLNLAVASFAVAAFEGKWWGVIPGILFIFCAIYVSRGI